MTTFGSVCSGIEAASVAWHPMGWRAAWLAEIEPFPSAVLAHHYPEVPNLGDMTRLADMIEAGQIEAPDVFCGGTPCQAFSVAGLRASSGGGDKPHVLAPVYTTKLHNTGSNNAGKLFEERTTCLDANSPPPALLTAMRVRRLTAVNHDHTQNQYPTRPSPL